MDSDFNRDYFTKATTGVIKGILILLMFAHHFFQFPQWYISGISYPSLRWFGDWIYQFKICVPVFAFISGYFYAFRASGGQTYAYAWQKAVGIYRSYWCVLVPLFIVAALTGTADYSWKAILYEVFAIHGKIMFFCWYVLFYVLLMLIFPLVFRFKGKTGAVVMILSAYVPMIVFRQILPFIKDTCLYDIVFNFQMYFPMAIIGYATAQYGWFECMSKLLEHPRLKCLRIPVSFIIMATVFCLQAKLFCWRVWDPLWFPVACTLRTLAIPFFVFGLVNCLKPLMNYPKALAPLTIIGKESLNMWLVHGVFFGASKQLSQHLLYFPGNPLLVFIWGLFICLGMSYFTEWLASRPLWNRTT